MLSAEEQELSDLIGKLDAFVNAQAKACAAAIEAGGKGLSQQIEIQRKCRSAQSAIRWLKLRVAPTRWETLDLLALLVELVPVINTTLEACLLEERMVQSAS